MKRVLILGNSITRHGPLAAVGWPHNWGMAASGIEKDYVHVLEGYMKQAYPQSEMLFFNIADFERGYAETRYDEAEPMIELAKQWKPDVVVLRIGENVADLKAPENKFDEYYEGLIEHLRRPNNAAVFCVSSFGRNVYVNDIMRRVADKLGCFYEDISALGDDPANKAIGLFENQGVCDHPGDLGMEKIAQAIWTAMESAGYGK